MQEVAVSKETIQKTFGKLRLNIVRYFEQNPVLLGGNGIVCQIDESLFRHKPKYHRGRAADHEKWVFGIAGCSYSPAKIYLKLVQNRSATTLLPIVHEFCRNGTIIFSDQWRAYSNIASLGFEHYSVNHSLNFIDPISLVHTQNIESYWAKAKLRCKRMKGVYGLALSSYLNEWMFKDNEIRGDFQKVIDLVRLYK